MADTANETQYVKKPSYPEPPKPTARRPTRSTPAKTPSAPKPKGGPDPEKVMQALRMMAAMKGARP